MTEEETEAAKTAVASRIADYVVNHHETYKLMTPEEKFFAELIAVASVRVLTDDIGASQDYLNAIGVDVDLYKEALRDSPSEPLSLHQELRAIMSKYQVDKQINMLDSQIATYIIDTLKTLGSAIRRRDRFYNFETHPTPELPVEPG